MLDPLSLIMIDSTKNGSADARANIGEGIGCMLLSEEMIQTAQGIDIMGINGFNKSEFPEDRMPRGAPTPTLHRWKEGDQGSGSSEALR